MNRRDFLLTSSASILSLAAPSFAFTKNQPYLTNTIPSSGESIAAIGMGSWITFDVGRDDNAIQNCTDVLQHFFSSGGSMVDSSPMYGSSETVIGKCLAKINKPDTLFSATKVWTPGRAIGITQMQESQNLWGVNNFDLMQIHNLLDWNSHIKTLREWKDSGRIRYLGVTTSHGRRHEELINIIQTEPLDFVQFTYNVIDREAEDKLLPVAADRGIAVIINRPFRRGQLFEHVGTHALPSWAKDIECENWAQYFLKYIISHPAVTVAIPATSRVDHMDENMGALLGPLPDETMRNKMLTYFQTL